LQRPLAVAAGLMAAAAAATVGYDIGTRINPESTWLGVVMALNLGLLVGILASLLADRAWTWLRRARRGEP